MNLASTQEWALTDSREMSDEQFIYWKILVAEKTGILLPDHRRIFLQSNLNIRMKEIACQEYDEYFEILSDDVGGELEWAVLTDRLTVHETCFLRHEESFSLVKQYLSRLIAKRAEKKRPITLWSAGCSTGEEAYSLALMIEELILELGVNVYYGINATDISLPALSAARTGEFEAKRVQMMSPKQKKILFDKKSEHVYQVKEKIKDKICFARINLLDKNALPLNNIDIVFCQNVLIYFDNNNKNEIIKQFFKSMNTGGLLVLGPGDITRCKPEKLRRIKFPDVLALTKTK